MSMKPNVSSVEMNVDVDRTERQFGRLNLDVDGIELRFRRLNLDIDGTERQFRRTEPRYRWNRTSVPPN